MWLEELEKFLEEAQPGITEDDFYPDFKELMAREAFRTCSDLDFLKNTIGSKDTPVILDDGDSAELKAKVLKAFTDLKALDAQTRERWTGNKFIQGQLRILCDNPYAKDDKVLIAGVKPKMTKQKFLDLIAPAFNQKIPRGNLEAVTERAVVVLLMKTKVVIRLPFRDDLVVIPVMKNYSLLEPNAPKIMENYYIQKKGLRDNFRNMVEHELKFLIALFRTGEVKLPSGIVFGDYTHMVGC